MRHLGLILLLLPAACTPSPDVSGPVSEPSGPPTVEAALVRQHAQQFDVDVPNRPGGSQHELAAATYILGHLQLAGYAPTLDAVPVAHQVQSTNVVAPPPNGDDPEVMVAIGYDDDGTGIFEGAYLGAFLEIARALNVAAPDHSVAFVALGAEDSDSRGSRRLAAFIADRDLEPQIVVISTADRTRGSIAVLGSCQGDGGPGASGFSGSVSECFDEVVFDGSVYEGVAAGETLVRGDPYVLGPQLLRLLMTTED